MRDIYPPYERNAKQLVDNQFNKYGAAFATASEWNPYSITLGDFKIYLYKHEYTIIYMWSFSLSTFCDIFFGDGWINSFNKEDTV